jgi:capsular exopolysaccharide synthesis family protein
MMELKRFLQIVSRYRFFIGIMCLSAVVTAVLLTYVVSEKYVSSASILIRPQKSLNFVPRREEILSFPIGYYTPIETASKTYSQIIKERTIAERVVKILGLHRYQETYGTGLKYLWNKTKIKVKKSIAKLWNLLKYGRVFEEDHFNGTVSKVMGSLSVKPTKETYLFKVEADWVSPEMAAAIANTAAEVFMEYLQELSYGENRNARDIAVKRLKESEKKLNESRAALINFKKKNNIVSLKKEMELQLELLSRLEDSRESIITKITGLEARKKSLIKKISELQKFSMSTTKVTKNPLVRELQSQLAKNEVRLAGLRKRYTPEHREIQALLAENEKIREKMKSESPELKSEEMMSVDPIYRNLSSELTSIETDLNSLMAEKERIEAAIRDKKRQVDQIPSIEAELRRLELAVSLNEETHKLLTKEYDELQISSTDTMPQIQIIQRAVTPLYPSRPIKVYHAGLAGLLSLLTGIGISLILENLNMTIRSIDEAEQKLGFPVIMTIPRVNLEDSAHPLLISDSGREPTEENRIHARACVQLPLHIRYYKGEDMISVKAVSSDIGPGGIFCYIEEKTTLKEGDHVEVSILLSDSSTESLDIRGTVVRCKNGIFYSGYSSIAIRFDETDDAVTSKIENIVRIKNAKFSYALPNSFEESIRGLRSHILFMEKKNLRTFLVTSSGYGEGKSTMIANLAVSLVEAGKKVVVIDANLRDPALHTIFAMTNDSGLSSTLLSGNEPFLKRSDSGLTVLTSGPATSDPSALIESPRMINLLNHLKDEFDIVLVDSPAVLAGPDAELLASMVDGVVFVVNAGISEVNDCRRATQILKRINSRMLGIVMNNFQGDAESYYVLNG